MDARVKPAHDDWTVPPSSSQRAAGGDQHVVQTLAARLMREQHVADIALELGRTALVGRLELGADISALFAAERHQTAPKRLLLALILQKAGDDILSLDGVRQARGIQCRL